MLVVALVSLVVHSSMRLHISQCFQCVKTDNVHKTRFSAFNVVLAEKRVLTQEMLVLALASLILHNFWRLPVSQCFHCVNTDNVHKTHF